MKIARIVVICDRTRFSSRLQAWGEKLVGRKPHPAMPYHVGWLVGDMQTGRIYDMHRKFRCIEASYYANRDVRIFNSPVPVSEEYLQSMVGKRSYGTIDVLLYPILTPLGINWMGTHCSESINDDINFHGYRTPFSPYGAPPSPADLLYWLEGLK